MSYRLPYKPLPKQSEFHLSHARFRVFAGGMGSGKTKAGVAETIKIATYYRNNLILVGRATYPELRDTTWRELLDMEVEVDGKTFPFVVSPLVKSHNKAEHRLTLINGTEIIGRSLLDSFDKIKSLNLGAFWVDELTEIPEEIWLGLVGRLRRKGVWHTGFGTTNPEGHDWVWKRWVMQPDSDHFLVQASSRDNGFLPEGYVDSLVKNYPEEWVKRYVFGSFDTFSGLVYGEFKDEKPCVIKPFDIPKGWYRFVALDYGYRNPTAVLWFAVSPKGIAYVYDEFYSSGKLVSELAEIIKAKTGSAKVQMYLGDPSMGNKNGITGRSVLDEFADAGVVIQKANNSVSAGINRVKERLKDRTLVIFSNCTNLRTELQTYKWKDLKPGAVQDGPEKPVKRGDHACFVGGTMIDTPSGRVPIRKLRVGDYVMTRMGPRRVLASGCTDEDAEVFKVRFSDGKQFVATHNHPVWTDRGWVEVGDLTQGDAVCVLNRLSSMALHSDVTLIRKTMPVEVTIGQHQTTFEPEFSIYTERFGSQFTGTFQTGSIFTIETRTPETMTSQTLNVSRHQIISPDILGSDTPRIRGGARSILRKFAHWLLSGIGRKTEGRGIVSMAGGYGQALRPFDIPAKSVGASLNQRHTVETSSSAIRIAEPVIFGGDRKPHGRERVYNITVDGGEYFANGVLVHNCDALRYGTVYLYDTPIVKQKSYAFDYQGTKNEQEPSSWMAA